MNLPRFSVQNPVAVNLLMWVIILAGAFYWTTMVREFFPNSDPEKFYISVAYPGATPDEVEKAVTRRIEREIEDVQNIKKVESRVLEGATAVVVTLEEGADRNRVLSDLRGEMDKVKAELPDTAEDPEITEQRPFIPVIQVVLFGDVSEIRLKEQAIRVRDDLRDFEEISEVAVSGRRKSEIWVEVQPDRLEEHKLTFQQVGQTVASSNLDLPGGQLESRLGNIRVRTMGEENRARQIEKIIVQGGNKGQTTRLQDLGKVRETFEDKVERGRFQGKRAITLTVFKTPEQDAMKIAARVKGYVQENPSLLGGAVEVKTTTDLSRFIEGRLDLMKRNGKSGLLLVCICLAFFLNIKVAFWVAIGIPISFMGTFVVMDWLGATINLLSLFGLIVVLGMIVDDAIVVGENVFTKIENGMHPMQAAVDGTTEMAVPVTAAVLTSIVAFLPLAFLDGRIGTFMAVLPVVVIAALGVSLIEAFIILPAHLGHIKDPHKKGDEESTGWRDRLSQTTWGRGWIAFGEKKQYLLGEVFPDYFGRLVAWVTRWRYVAVVTMFSFSLLVIGLVAARVIPFVFLPKTDAEDISINLEMAVGTTEEKTEAVLKGIEKIVRRQPEVKSVFAVVGTSFSEEGRATAADPATVGQINIALYDAEEREKKGMRTAQEVISVWRAEVGDIPGVKKLKYIARSGGPGGADIEIQVRGESIDIVAKAVKKLREEIESYTGIISVEDDLNRGKREVRVRLREKARLLGLTTRDVALQLRHALYGFEIQDLQEEDEEVTVRVLLPKSSRREISDLSRLRIATPSGGRVPLQEVADLTTARGYGSLARVDGKRAITVKAEVDQAKGNTAEITDSLAGRMPEIMEQYPGVTLSYEGRKQETRESFSSLAVGFPAALLMIYIIIAILFRSYIQPAIIMLAIPYAIIGAILGHFFMGYPVTILSMIGCVALSGIVVNDSLILIDYVNRLRREGMDLFEAVITGAKGRLRPILLTSTTTVFGLAPLMMEKSFQAKFLIPMAVSIVFGLAFATIIILLLIPCYYLILEDLFAAYRWLVRGEWTYEGREDHGLEFEFHQDSSPFPLETSEPRVEENKSPPPLEEPPPPKKGGPGDQP